MIFIENLQFEISNFELGMANQDERRGSIAIVVMVCLVVIAMLSGVLLRLGLAGREVIRGEERRLQAEWLAESGVARASARLAEAPAYPGETWERSAEQMAGPAPGLVTIAVETPDGKPNQRRVRVVAEYPRGDRAARVGKQVVIDLEPARKGDSP
jgi:hypothetical protein